MRQEDDGEKGRFGHEPDFDGVWSMVNAEGRRQYGAEQEENAVEEADGGDVVEEEYATSYEDVLWDGRSDHRDSLSLCFWLCWRSG